MGQFLADWFLGDSGIDVLGLDLAPPINMSSLQNLAVKVVEDPQCNGSIDYEFLARGPGKVAQALDLLVCVFISELGTPFFPLSHTREAT